VENILRLSKLPDPEDEATGINENVSKYLPVNTALYLRRRIYGGIIIYNVTVKGNHTGTV